MATQEETEVGAAVLRMDEEESSSQKNFPECAVCLELYDSDFHVPRVLACGHTICEPCLVSIPEKFSQTIRCPICNQLVKFPSSIGPSSLPKNIELLHFTIPCPISHAKNEVRFSPPPRLWCKEFYESWRRWILGRDDVLTIDTKRVLMGREVDVFKIGNVKEQVKCSSFTTVDYTAMIVNALNKISERARGELSLIIESTSKSGRCNRNHGLWSDSIDGSLYLVFESLPSIRFIDDALMKDPHLPSVAVNGMDACESLMFLHLEGAVAGILGVCCFQVDQFGRLSLNVGQVLGLGRLVNERLRDVRLSYGSVYEREFFRDFVCWLFEKEVYASPELLSAMMQNMDQDRETESLDFLALDVWSMGCFLLRLLLGKNFTNEMINFLNRMVLNVAEDTCMNIIFDGITGKVRSLLELESEDEILALKKILCRCLDFDSQKRPLISNVWNCIRGLIFKTPHPLTSEVPFNHESRSCCLVLTELCQPHNKALLACTNDASQVETIVDNDEKRDLIKGLLEGRVISKDLPGLLDCITGLVVGGDLLFGASYDKLVHVWSLQENSHVHAFKGHNHKVMAVAFIEEEEMCVSGDGGGGIFIWSTKIPLQDTPIKSWYEKKDWRYSGIHSLIAPGNGYIYTGSGDRTIKAWNLTDGFLHCTMEGHRSVVSALSASDGVLHSGSWDGTIRLWSLSDHTLLTVLSEGVPSVLSLKSSRNLVVAGHENGLLKIWRNDVLEASVVNQVASIFAVDVCGSFLCSGGRDKAADIQEICGDELQIDVRHVASIPGDSAITAVLFLQEMLFIGYGNRTLKVFYSGDCF